MGRVRKPNNTYNSKVTPARKLAYDVLTEIRVHKVFLEQAWNKLVRNYNLPPAEIAFARLLATQVVSHRGSLDELINSILKSPDDIQSNVRDALRISFSELFYLGKQDHVVVNEGVELVRSVAPKASGVANFALRRACELKPSFPFGDPKTELKAASLAFGYPSWLISSLRDSYGIDPTNRFLQNCNDPAPFFFFFFN